MEDKRSFIPERLYVGSVPKHLIEKSLKQQSIKRQKLRASTIEKLQAINFKYYCSVCLIIRDESEYLEEWLMWHIAQGVEHFYIYDHGSKYPVKEFINSLGIEISKKVTVIDWLGKHKDAQPEAYNDCLERFKQESRWIGFIDADEHVRVKTGQTLPVFLKNYEEYAGLFAVWLIYNANGHKFQSTESLRKRFTRVSYADERASQMGKVFVQPMYMVDMVIHNGRALEGFCVVDEHKHKVYNYSLISEKPTTDLICVTVNPKSLWFLFSLSKSFCTLVILKSSLSHSFNSATEAYNANRSKFRAPFIVFVPNVRKGIEGIFISNKD